MTRTEDTRLRSRPERTRREGRKILRVARRCTDEPRDTESIFVGWLRRWRDKKPAASTPNLASLFLSLSFLSDRFIPHFPLRPTLSSATAHRLLFFPFATAASLALFFSSRYASFYATAQLRFVPVSRPFSSLSDTRNLPISLSLSPPVFLRLSCSRTQPPPSFFSPILPSPFLFDAQTDRARERANEKIRTT